MKVLLLAIVTVVAAISASAFALPTDAEAGADATMRAPALYKNCTALNKKYAHGVGRVGARDKTTGDAVTNFKRSSKIYKLAMSYNKGLDRDKDGVACEQE